MTIDEVKSYYGSFDCEVLTSNPQNEMEIRDFTCHIRNNTLENYLKTDAWKEDIDGETRVYLIREHNTRQIVLFFSLKCGTLFTTYKLDDSYNELEEAQKSLVDEMVNLRLNHNDDQFYQMFKQIQTSVYKGYKQDNIEMRGDRAEMSDFPLYLNTVAGGLDRRDQTIGGFSFVVKIYAVPVVEIIG